MYTTNSVIVQTAKPFGEDKTRELVTQFQRDGYLFLKGVMTPSELDIMREVMERKFQDPKMHEEEGDHIRGMSMMRMYEYDINSDQVRYVGSVVYSQRIIAQKLYPFIDYRMPEYVWEGTDERMQRLLGRHEKGAYG